MKSKEAKLTFSSTFLTLSKAFGIQVHVEVSLAEKTQEMVTIHVSSLKYKTEVKGK